MHAEFLVVGHQHAVGRGPPGGDLIGGDVQVPGPGRVLLGHISGRAQVLLGHQVGEHVVVRDRAVLVRPGDPVDVERAGVVQVAQRVPQPRRLHQQVVPGGAGELVVAGGVHVADHGRGDVRVHVERGRAGRPVAGAFLAGDGAPREGGAAQAELAGPLLRPGQRAVPPAQLMRGGVRDGVGEHREHVGLGVPERVPVVAIAGQALGRDRPPLGPRPGLQHVEHAEPDRLLDLVVAVEFHVGPATRSRPGNCAAHPPAHPSRTPPRPAAPPRPGLAARAGTGPRTSRS